MEFRFRIYCSNSWSDSEGDLPIQFGFLFTAEPTLDYVRMLASVSSASTSFNAYSNTRTSTNSTTSGSRGGTVFVEVSDQSRSQHKGTYRLTVISPI